MKCSGIFFGNAVYDAVGIRFHKLPITPEVMLKALQDKNRIEGRTKMHTNTRILAINLNI